jgi:hypothetical protein
MVNLPVKYLLKEAYCKPVVKVNPYRLLTILWYPVGLLHRHTAPVKTDSKMLLLHQSCKEDSKSMQRKL